MASTEHPGARVTRLVGVGLEFVAGAVLVFVMVLTGFDIVGRMFGRPIPGTYEIVSFAGGLVIGLAMPVTSWARGHVFVDLVTANATALVARFLHRLTRALAIALFALLAWGLVRMGIDLRNSGETTAVLGLAFYPIAWALAGAFVVSCLSLAHDAFTWDPRVDD